MHGILATKPIIITGTERLLNDVRVWLIASVAVITIFVLLKDGFVWYQADEQTRPAIVRKMKQALYMGIFLCCVAALVPWIFSYFV